MSKLICHVTSARKLRDLLYDLDLLSNQVSLPHIEALAEELSKIEQVQYKSTTVQTRRFNNRKMTTYARVAGRG